MLKAVPFAFSVEKVRQLEKSTPPLVVAVVTNMSYDSKPTLVTLWSLGTLWVHSEETQRTLTFLGLCCNVLYDDYHDKKMIWNLESNVKKWC